MRNKAEIVDRGDTENETSKEAIGQEQVRGGTMWSERRGDTEEECRGVYGKMI